MTRLIYSLRSVKNGIKMTNSPSPSPTESRSGSPSRDETRRSREGSEPSLSKFQQRPDGAQPPPGNSDQLGMMETRRSPQPPKLYLWGLPHAAHPGGGNAGLWRQGEAERRRAGTLGQPSWQPSTHGTISAVANPRPRQQQDDTSIILNFSGRAQAGGQGAGFGGGRSF